MCADVDADAEITIVKLVKIIKYGLEGIKMDVKEKKRGREEERVLTFVPPLSRQPSEFWSYPCISEAGWKRRGLDFGSEHHPSALDLFSGSKMGCLKDSTAWSRKLNEEGQFWEEKVEILGLIPIF